MVVALCTGRCLCVAMLTGLKVVLVEADPSRAASIAEGIQSMAECVVVGIDPIANLAERIAQNSPQVVLIDLDNPTRDILEELTLASGPLERPVAMFVSGDSDGLAQAAVEAGVSAYVVDGLAPDRLRPVIDTAIARFNVFRRMRTELAETRRALEERKLIDRAKGLLMKARKIDEDAAYALLRKAAMDQGKRLAEVAQALVTASELLS